MSLNISDVWIVKESSFFIIFHQTSDYFHAKWRTWLVSGVFSTFIIITVHNTDNTLAVTKSLCDGHLMRIPTRTTHNSTRPDFSQFFQTSWPSTIMMTMVTDWSQGWYLSPESSFCDSVCPGLSATLWWLQHATLQCRVTRTDPLVRIPSLQGRLSKQIIKQGELLICRL